MEFRRKKILIAVNGIENGEYGLCKECEEPGNEKWLLLMPFTRFCVGCQSEIERQARIRGQLAA